MLLPAPDYLEFQLSDRGVCAITDDGSPLTEQVAQRLSDQGWSVIVLEFPIALVTPALSTGSDRLPLTVADQTLVESRLQQQLATVAQTYGSIHTFIHLHPQHPVCDKSVVKAVFFLAKQLQPFLVQTGQRERRSFITVTRLDGELGLGTGSSRPVSGGLFGLTKTLRLEWPTVFCRAVDIAPELSATEAANALLAELHDPNVFIREVGHGRSGRMTLTCLSEAAR